MILIIFCSFSWEESSSRAVFRAKTLCTFYWFKYFFVKYNGNPVGLTGLYNRKEQYAAKQKVFAACFTLKIS
jgi:hypothetical protein